MKKKTLIRILLFLFAFLLIQEFTDFQFTLYRSKNHLQSHTSINFTTRSPLGWGQGANILKPIALRISNPNSQREYITLDVEDSRQQFEVEVVPEYQLGWQRFIPFVKYVSYSSDVSIKGSFKYYGKDLSASTSALGNAQITGYYWIYGFCSGRHAKSLVEDAVHRNLEKEISQRVDNFMRNFKE